VECFIYINNYGSVITYTWYAWITCWFVSALLINLHPSGCTTASRHIMYKTRFFSLLMNILVFAKAVPSLNQLDVCSSFDFRIHRHDSREADRARNNCSIRCLWHSVPQKHVSVTSEANKQEIRVRIFESALSTWQKLHTSFKSIENLRLFKMNGIMYQLFS
jgi:hypothetical protein